MVYNSAFLLIFLCVGIVTLFGLKGVPWFLPVKLFVYFNWIMGAGILFILNYENSVDLAHGVVILISAFAYGFGSVLVSNKFFLAREWKRFVPAVNLQRQNNDFRFSVLLYVFSGFAVLIYFQLVGYNVILTSLTSSLSAADVKNLRLASYAGDEYYAPGYFNQFKNILFPISFLALTSHLRVRIKSKIIFSMVFVGLILPVIMGLMGTGQRAFLVGFLIVSLIFMSIKNLRGLAITKFTLLLIFVVFILLFSVSSYLLGRSEDFSVFNSLNALAVRLFSDNQSAALVGFQYIYNQEVQFGTEWITDILGILPGEYKGSDLANQIHAIIYGSERGTAPVSLWGSVFYNWGWFGIVLFPLFLSFFYCSVSRYFLKRQGLTSLEIAGYAFSFYVLGAWIASGPMQLVNNGIVACVILIYGLRAQRTWRKAKVSEN